MPRSALLVLLAAAPTLAVTGVDVSQSVSESSWSCLQGSGGQGAVEFAVVRAYQSVGRVDPNAAATIKAARAAGVKYVDAYLFPCPKCSNGIAAQVKDTVTALRNAGAKFGILWLDVEAPNLWGSQASNVAILKGFASACKSLGVVPGVYANWNSWSEIMGNANGYSVIGQNLWYPHYDGVKSFSDFQAFGGWSKPNIKQYLADKSSCSAGVDYNWYP
eukprot:TRINITY_DN4051_c0_g1_i1.p2 TRINITY_DN4051_c0_g1~~TRINITY_DN4051_c0_g1_i1.p2  ORF type:complete len:218 (+),score=46.95 TRINITY_DN4051_c0_g1_i1:93-746(+)